jgi:hypothetical protein
MTMNHSKLSIATTLTIITSLALLLPFPDVASADNQCQLDQRQLVHQGAIPFGGPTVLGQTFIPAVPGHRICRVKVMITKNFAGADNVTLRVLGSNLAPLDASVTIPGGPIPVGNSMQVFDFGCNGVPLAAMPFYGLRLESPNSPPGAYSWRGGANNPYIQPGNGGRGWRNLNGKPGNWTSLGGWDYAFEIYMCD